MAASRGPASAAGHVASAEEPSPCFLAGFICTWLWHSYTNQPFGVGRRASSGCVRVYPHDIVVLYTKVETGTPVTISYQPSKAAGNGNNLLLGVHPDYLGRFKDLFQWAFNVIAKARWQGRVNYSQVREVARAQRGIPEIVAVRLKE